MHDSVAIPKGSREYLQNQYRSGRMNLLPVLLLTVINIVSLLVGNGSYWVFSAVIPYSLTAFGFTFDRGVVGTYTATGLVMTAAILAIYLACLLFSKKHSGWLMAALVLFAIDTLAVVLMAWLGNALVDSLLDIILHSYILVALTRGCIAAVKLKQMPEEEASQLDETQISE